jgi:hypothetical protein
VPEKVNDVSLLGEKLVVTQMDGQQTFTAEGRPIAVVSNAQVEYQPAPVKPTPKKKTAVARSLPSPRWSRHEST